MDKLGLKNFYIFTFQFSVEIPHNNGFVMNIMGKVCQQPTSLPCIRLMKVAKMFESRESGDGGQKQGN